VRRSATRVAPADETESVSAPDPLLEEARRLRQVRAIREPRDQLRQLTLLATQFPAGQLQTERQLLQSSVLLRLGRDTEACSLLRQVSRAQPHGPYTQRTEQLLQRCGKPARVGVPTRGALDPM
jgi:hypothetical protein